LRLNGNHLAENTGMGRAYADPARGGCIMNRDELKGKAEKAKGYIKEETGEILNDPELEAEGKAERAGGAVREKFGQAKEKVSEAADDLIEDDEDEVK
jgi:uncharacterized protein YjbJ (UPF0337 family)